MELGIAYCQKDLQNKDTFLVGLQTDARAAFRGSKLNPMVHVSLQYVAEDEKNLARTISDHRARVE